MDNIYFTIERAGVLKKRFRARMYGGNNELVWMTQTYADKRDARAAIDFVISKGVRPDAEVRDLAHG